MGALAREIHDIALSKGWWDEDRNDGELIALIHCELSALVEGLRAGNPPSEHIPEFSAAEEEAADVVIRLMDMCAARGWRLGDAMVDKMEFNEERPRMHGGKKF